MERLGEIDGELARLRYRHDIAMSAFLFEEATALGRAIAALEAERQTLADQHPAAGPAQPASGIIPALVRPRRRRNRRIG
jgi:hypothetical protein